MASFDRVAEEAGIELSVRTYDLGEVRRLMTETAEVTRRECHEEWTDRRNAAPDLLAACKAALLMTDGANPAHEAIHRQVNAAITKAESH
jgi:hypothetical protein